MKGSAQSTELDLRTSGIESLGSHLGSLKVAPGKGLSRVPVHQMQYWFAAGMALLVGIVGYIGFTFFNMAANSLEILFLLVFVALAIAIKILLHVQFRESRQIDVHENGLQFQDPRDFVGVHKSFVWAIVDPRHNRVTIQPASQLVNDRMLRFRLTFRLNDFEIAQPCHEMDLLAGPKDRELARYVSTMMGCQDDEWVGYLLY